jgi:hypothetical protein
VTKETDPTERVIRAAQLENYELVLDEARRVASACLRPTGASPLDAL